jgi:2-amino-4-hydroxy-6-hydroxymethyldihydropteridine diphosphokinase
MSNIAYLSLGSNIEPETNLVTAVAMLAGLTRLRAVSSVWETLPLGLADQPNFLNAAAIVETELAAGTLKAQVLSPIEQKLGRVRQTDKNAPRPMDIDIMLFNRQRLQVGNRYIPDPEILERPFVAIPLAEIAPDYVHPETGQTLAEIAATFDSTAAGMTLHPGLSERLRQLLL